MEEMEELTYLFDFKTPPKIVTDASGKKVEVILSYDDYIEQACSKRWRKKVIVTDIARKSFDGISDSSFMLGIEYEEE